MLIYVENEGVNVKDKEELRDKMPLCILIFQYSSVFCAGKNVKYPSKNSYQSTACKERKCREAVYERGKTFVLAESEGVKITAA